MRFSFSRVLWALAAVVHASATPAGAGSLEIAPTTVVLQQDGKAGVLYVNNYGNTAVSVQVEPFDWRQVDGQDQLTPSQALMSSPPIAAIPAQGKQTVRLMAAPEAAVQERCFRLVVSELPDAGRRASHTIQVLTQFSVPVFEIVASNAAPDLTWAATTLGETVQISATNRGSRHAKIEDLGIVMPAGASLMVPNGGLNYILAGSRHTWIAPCAQCAAGKSIRITGNEGVLGTKIDQPLVLGR